MIDGELTEISHGATRVQVVIVQSEEAEQLS